MFKFPDELMFIKNSRAKQKQSSESMAGKLCVIAGATSGVGLAAARALAAGGADIVMIIRNESKAQAVKREIEGEFPVFIDYFIADFSDLKQVRQAAQAILDKYPKIDVLINSAGIHNTRRILNKDNVEMVFCVNHLASFLLTNLLLERMIQSAPSRIIQVNSEGHRFSGVNIDDVNWDKHFYTGLRGYGASKSAQLLTVWHMAQALEGTGVTINAMHPGAVKTNIGNNNGWLYRWYLRNVTWHFLKDPRISGEALYYLASSPKLNDVSGKFFNLTILETPARHALDPVKQKQIWDLSMEMVDLAEQDD